MNNKVKCSKFVENLKEYKTASQQVWKLTDKKQREDVIKADWNESVVPPSPKTKKSVLDFIKNYPLNWYPDVEASKLKLSLEKYVKLSKSYIQVFNGSDAALEYVVRAFIDQGDEVI
ncbi:MAG: histidinol-phosphate aminotransferase family protein, partial [Proteobacteria bacterium]|nr:histidinol-phosphate aminotransferase family protein [Pseudomonadota bacterium]